MRFQTVRDGAQLRRYYPMGDVRLILDESASCLRFWMNHFDITTKRVGGNKRKFTQEDIEVLQEIKRLIRVEHYTLKGAALRIAEKKKAGAFQG